MNQFNIKNVTRKGEKRIDDWNFHFFSSRHGFIFFFPFSLSLARATSTLGALSEFNLRQFEGKAHTLYLTSPCLGMCGEEEIYSTPGMGARAWTQSFRLLPYRVNQIHRNSLDFFFVIDNASDMLLFNLRMTNGVGASGLGRRMYDGFVVIWWNCKKRSRMIIQITELSIFRAQETFPPTDMREARVIGKICLAAYTCGDGGKVHFSNIISWSRSWEESLQWAARHGSELDLPLPSAKRDIRKMWRY